MYRRRLCLCLGALLLWATPADGDGFRVLVRTEDEDGLKLAQRIEGQASDLEVEITVIAADELEFTVEAQLRTADRLAAEHDAQAVVWWERARSDAVPINTGWRLYILHPGRGRVLVRSLGGGTEQARANSAVLEEAALIVRATLQALAVGAEIGVERSLVERLATPPRRREPSPADHQSLAAPRRASADSVVAVSAGWQIAFDGASPPGQPGPTLRAGYLGAPWQVGLTLAYSLGAELESGPVTIRLARHAATSWMGLRTSGSPWELAAGAQFGLALFTRSTTGTASGLTPSAKRIYWSLLVGPELSLSFRPLWPRHAWRVGFVAGADYVPRAPELGIGTQEEFRSLDALWLVEPRSSLYLGLEF